MFARLTRFAIVATALLAAPLHASDLEIYIGASELETEVKPNVLFIIDTSRSMGDMNPKLEYSEYDAATDYPGACTDDKVYWGTSGSIPPCTTANWFYQTNNVCQTFNSSDGFLNDRIAMWNPSTNKWVTTLTSANHALTIECEADVAGKDGKVDGDNLYAARSPYGQWTSNYSRKLSYGGYYQIYSANYLNYLNSGGTAPEMLYRIEVVKRVLTRILQNTSGINAAVMRFNVNPYSINVNGGRFITPMLQLNDTNRPTLINAVKTLDAVSDTPLAETLYEATLYFRGENEYFAKDKNVAGVSTANKYISPIKYQCQKNFIVLFSDGDPYDDGAADWLINHQVGFNELWATPPNCKFSSNYSDCLSNQARYLYRGDHSSLNDKQNVVTYTIGFETGMSSFGLATMKAAANEGNGFYRGAKSAKDITEAFNAVLTNILSVNTSFTAPAVSVNAFNRLTYLDQLYYGLFKTGDQPRWDGNLKRYRLAFADGGTAFDIVDVRGETAIDPNTGFFASTAESYWSGTPDGDEVTLGGAASQMPTYRKAYTCCYGGSNALTYSTNLLHESNASITAATLGAADSTEREKLLKWARGVDVYDGDADGTSTDARAELADPLHTEPLLVTYGQSGGVADLTLFATTNEGFLHAIDTKTGAEIFSYMPKELLGNIRPMATDDIAGGKRYGLDGPMTAWVYDKDYDGTIEPGDGDHVYLYLAMRRGGSNVYALDVTDRSAPTQLWKIEGGTGSFSELGQTWSKPIVAKVKLAGTERWVVFFGGGYDPVEDNYTVPRNVPDNDGIGRAIYMVDASTGALLWTANPNAGANLKLTSMTNSIPSDLRVLDINGDGLADRIYTGDMRGRIWRFDLSKDNSGAANFASGGILAKFSVEGSSIENRRFYYNPSVSMSAKGDYLNIAIGSGYREHPLDTDTRDRFYVIRDRNVEGPEMAGGSPVYTLLTNFVDATDWLTPGDISASEKAALDNSNGFYIDLSNGGVWQGEKVLAPALTLNGYVVFTTFTPVNEASKDACAPSQGTAREYIMSVEDSTTYNSSSRSEELARGGPPPRPVAMTTEDGSAVIIGTHKSRSAELLNQVVAGKTNWKRE